jgi:transcriptional regulator with XRE-family HTH domain
MDLQKKLDAITGNQPSTWKEKALYRKNNQDWLKRSQAIAIRILEALRAKNMSQKLLAEKLDVSPQQVSKILKGTENLTLQTITQIETVLGIKLIYLLSISHTENLVIPTKKTKTDYFKTVSNKTTLQSTEEEAMFSESIITDDLK